MKYKITRKDARAFAVDTLYFLAGGALCSLGLYTFALNAHFAPGGVSGLALLINHFTALPIGMMSLVLNIPLILVCARVLGGAFVLKSSWTMLINTVMLDLVFPHLPTYRGNPLLAAIFTGAALGAGLAIAYMRGSSTGGVDFITMSVKKKNPHLSVGKITLVADAAVILLGGLVFGNVDAVLYGIVASFASTMTMDAILYGAGSGKLAIIVTDHGQQIADAISVEVERGSTLVSARGGYTGELRELLLCVCSKNEIYKVRTAARAIDPGSMLMITEANEIFGKGFTPVRLPGNEDPAGPS